MSVILESVSNSTLVSAVSKLGIENDQQESTGIDTPIPKDNISDETINLLMEASSKLSREAPKEQRPKDNKRARRDRSPEPGTSIVQERTDYRLSQSTLDSNQLTERKLPLPVRLLKCTLSC